MQTEDNFWKITAKITVEYQPLFSYNRATGLLSVANNEMDLIKMQNSDDNKNQELEIDYSQLMDLRVDYAFKLLFSKGNPRLLISLLNATFANKKIPRLVKSLTIKKPYLEKESVEDKLSILDIRAELEDGTTVLIEMHMYGLEEIKAKTIRSWARAYGEELDEGANYSDQPPTIIITFTDGQIAPKEKIASIAASDKIHRLCMILDCEDGSLFTDAMELHYIDMRAFAKAVNVSGKIDVAGTEELMFARWLSIIAQKGIHDKSIIEQACEDKEEIQMAVSTLSRQGMDKLARQAYQRRKDEIYFQKKKLKELEDAKRKLEESEAALAEKDVALAEKDTALAEQEKIIAELRLKIKKS